MFQENAASTIYHPMNLAEVETAITDNEAYLIVLEDHMAVGCLIYTIDEDHVQLDEFVIGEKYRGHGFGTMALEAMLALVPGETVELLTHPDNPALHLYARNGFRYVEEVPNYYGDGEPRRLMRRPPQP
jgi:ribosomal protein S18 acetylase RimI-like enzyme